MTEKNGQSQDSSGMLESTHDEDLQSQIEETREFLSGMTRRRFLQATGFAVASTMIFGCSAAPEEEALPFLDQPEGMIPGRSDFYATTCAGCSAGCGILAKSRDGRPVKLEGNPEHPMSRGGLCAVGQASLLGLYDSKRLLGPLLSGADSTWEQVDARMAQQCSALRNRGSKVRYLSGPITSPTKRKAIDDFLAGFGDARLVITDPTMGSAILDAHQQTHGSRVAPHYRFDRAELIVSVDADFLGTWISPVEFTSDYSSRRQASAAEDGFAQHIHFESRMSVTGAKADTRVKILPSERAIVLNQLALHVAQLAHAPAQGLTPQTCSVDAHLLEQVAHRLWEHRGKSLLVSGSEDTDVQVLCNWINDLLGNYSKTLDLARPSYQLQGDDAALGALLDEIKSGSVDALFVEGINAALDLPGGDEFVAKLGSIPLLVSFSRHLDETSRLADVVCPDHHFLESWADVQSVHDVTSYAQPLVAPLGNTRQSIESLLVWSTGQARSAREILQDKWGTGEDWHGRLHDGFQAVNASDRLRVSSFQRGVVKPAQAKAAASGSLELVLYTKLGMPSSQHAFNPWLHELPDPITKAVWDNYASLSEATAERLGVSDNDVVRVAAADGGSVELPVLTQPGQRDDVVAVAMAYGSELSRRFAGVGPQWIERKETVGADGLVGIDATPLLAFDGPRRRFSGASVNLTATGRSSSISRTQDYHSIDVPEHLAPKGGERRPNIQETTVAALLHPGDHHGGAHHPDGGTMWPDDHVYTGHHWGMAIDLTTCTGCSACVIACQVENNIPVVGKDEVGRNREMHWLRIDRYYAENGGHTDVAHQPMMCHHCDNAPCETVCPVLATAHSDEGLNQQAYNRCVGTRYCMNNCPYKVRRFNWFEYAHEDEHENMALNPDVTIRSRGIMEKCSFCAQRIQEAKIVAKQRRGTVADGEIQTACEQSCPAKAIVFGDMNDAESRVSQIIASDRHFRVLEEIGVRPTVGYTTLVRNRPEDDGSQHHG